MSDGPHRSLPMRPGWKKLAERAANSNYAPDEISDAVIPALAQDWSSEISSELAGFVRDVLGGQQDSLFKDEKVAQFEALRRITSGHGFAQVFIDCGIQMAIEGRSGLVAPVEAATNALAVWASRGARQVEEHYCRESTVPRAHNVRARIEEGIGGASLVGLARQLLSPDPGAASRPPQKQRGLDDGVRL